jgi:hypothetical protein
MSDKPVDLENDILSDEKVNMCFKAIELHLKG